MAKFRHISTKLVLALDAGQVNGKKVTKRVTISNIREDASADALWELAEALGKLLAYPVAEVRLYKVEELVREAGDRDVSETGGVHKEADTDNVRAGGEKALPVAASRGGVSTGNDSFRRDNVQKEVAYIPYQNPAGVYKSAASVRKEQIKNWASSGYFTIRTAKRETAVVFTRPGLLLDCHVACGSSQRRGWCVL